MCIRDSSSMLSMRLRSASRRAPPGPNPGQSHFSVGTRRERAVDGSFGTRESCPGAIQSQQGTEHIPGV
eukprot:1852744-Pyramimonas_sp.AAC.1